MVGLILQEPFSIKTYSLALLLLASRVGTQTEFISCNGILFDDVYYEKKTLLEHLNQPYNLIICRSTAELFFSQTIRIGKEVDFTITAYNMNTKRHQTIDGISGGYAIAYSRRQDKLYFGGNLGIYTYDPHTHIMQFYGQKDKSIWGLFYQQDLYYIEFPTQELFVLKNGGFVKEKMIEMEITTFYSKDSEMFFSNATALFNKYKGSKATLVLHNNIEVRQIVEDNRGIIYFCTSNGIYIINKSKYVIILLDKKEIKFFNELKLVIAVDQAFGIAFDETNNLIYSDRHAIYKLVLSETKEGEVCAAIMNNVTVSQGSFIDKTRKKEKGRRRNRELSSFTQQSRHRGHFLQFPNYLTW